MKRGEESRRDGEERREREVGGRTKKEAKR